MKKYDTLNFFDNYNKNIKNIVILGVLIFITLNLLINIKEVKQLKTYIQSNETNTVVKRNKDNVKKDDINLNQIKNIYSLLGTENVEEISIINKDVQIQGLCKDLNKIKSIKEMDIVQNSSLDSLSKKDENYIFRLRYKTR